jgi:DNA-binding MurR/RpiR family transcriptional regulator
MMTEPKSLEDIKSAIAKGKLPLPKAAERVAREILSKPETVAFDSIYVIADRCEVGPSTVSRLARHLGFASFRDMRQLFRDQLRRSRSQQH